MQLDSSATAGVTVSSCAPGASHPECVSIPENRRLIRPGNDVRQGPGRRWAAPASVALLPTGVDGPRWYVGEVEPKAVRRSATQAWDEVLEASVVRAGWRCVVPQFFTELVDPKTKRVRWAGLLPAFPGYALFEIDRRMRGWPAVIGIPGITRLIGPDPMRPTPVAPVQAAWVLGQFGPGGARRQVDDVPPSAPLPIGAQAKVMTGLWVGWAGLIAESDGRQVVLDVAGKRVRLPQVVVEVCAPHAASAEA